MSKFSLVVPTYNEAPHIENICREITGVLEACGIGFEIIIVDDNSADGTWKAAQEMSHSDARIRLIRRSHRRGLASAVADGWSVAGGDILGVIDADFQHPPHVLVPMLDIILCRDDIDIVVASRRLTCLAATGLDPARVAVSRLACLFARILLSRVVNGVSDPMSGFFLLRKKVIETNPIKPMGYKILLEVLAKGRYGEMGEVLYTFNRRREGRSKMGPRQCVTSCFHIMKLAFLP